MAKPKTQAQLEKMTAAQLEAHRLDVQDDLAQIRQYARQVAHVYDSKADEAAAQAKLDSMSDAERQALAQILVPTGIASAEDVGTPGE